VEQQSERLRDWLLTEALPRLPSLPGLGSARLLEAAATPQSTNEQRIRGIDAAMDWAVLVAGYEVARLSDLVANELSAEAMRRHGAANYSAGTYEMHYSLTQRDAAAARALP
jgi:hypothetical protein